MTDGARFFDNRVWHSAPRHGSQITPVDLKSSDIRHVLSPRLQR